jgi:predicted secreted protein
MVVFLAMIIATSAVFGVASSVGSSANETSSGGSIILPAGTSFEVSSSFDCVASHRSFNFSVAEQSELTGGFSSGAPGVTAYVATVQQATSTFEGHPASWIYSTGLVNSSRFTVVLSSGSYVLWIEGADENCGSSIVTPLEMLTKVNITESFALSGQSTVRLVIRLELNSSRIASGSMVGISVSDYNPSPMELNLSRDSAWAFDGLSIGACPSLYYPFGIAVLQGKYTSSNVSQGTPLRIFPLVPCPMIVRLITAYIFQPMSDNATVLPGTGEVPMATEIPVGGTYNGGQQKGSLPFTPGAYTVVAGDEWGDLAFAYFVVATPSNGVQKYAYPTSNLSSFIYATVGETFIVQLGSNAASTGYDWNVSVSQGIQYLNYTVVSTSTLIGGSQVRNYFFRAVQKGTQTITLRDERPFKPYAIAATINLQVVVSGLAGTALTLSCRSSSVAVGYADACKATVQESGSTPVGMVMWSSSGLGKFIAATCRLSRGSCGVVYIAFSAGFALLTASYLGDKNNPASSGTFGLTVNARASRTSLYCSPTSVTVGSSKTIKCTALVIGYNPAGNVAWSQSGTGAVSFSSGTCTLAKGRCYVVLRGTAAGRVTIEALYSGDSNNAGSSETRNLMIG